MNEKNKVEILTDDLSLPGIKNYYFKVDKQDEKLEIFCDLIENAIFNLGIVFCNTKETVEQITKELQKRKYKVDSITGGMQRYLREATMKKFKSLEIQLLVTTDLMARGIDIQQVDLVLNYDLPLKHENFIHRIGRTGRYGR